MFARQIEFCGFRKMKHWAVFLGSIFLLLGLSPAEGYAQTTERPLDSLQISLLTCSPGEESYELFGHTAIRVQSVTQKIDWVFNYGLFSFNTPNFIWRFTKGETDYHLGVSDFTDFVLSYAMRGSSIHEQTLNLTRSEANALYEALSVNALPQNRVYRYNFLYDNCSTRACDMILASIKGKVLFEHHPQRETFREMITAMTLSNSWLTFGIDLALGAPLDSVATYRQTFFLPERLMKAFAQAHIERANGTITSLVAGEQEALASDALIVPASPNPLTTPLTVGAVLLGIVVLLSLYGCFRGIPYRWLDTLLFATAGLVGCLLFFLMFVSTHPATYPNYLAFWLHPFQFFVAIAVWVRTPLMRRILNGYHLLNLLLVLGLLLFWNLLPQRFNWAVFPLMLIWAVRSATYLIQSFLRRTNS